ncbi:hypothetical protein [Actinomadura flavalba]|uniref:hypothetical protein n=1 Tax=Actinomadura flavalba TaxID=1120938 RepID=UPI000376F6FF|nr:hypothetical protein [Actinomadura flavalba]
MEPFVVRAKAERWRALTQVVTALILVAASVAFVTGGVLRGFGLGGAVFTGLGLVGVVLFGAGLLVAVGRLFVRRPVLVVDDEGVLRPASWPLPAARGPRLRWEEVSALGALRRGVDGTSKGEQDYLVFLPTEEMKEMVRTAGRPHLVALTLPDVPKTALPEGAETASRWCLPVGPGWDVPLPALVKAIRARHEIPVVDRRTG